MKEQHLSVKTAIEDTHLSRKEMIYYFVSKFINVFIFMGLQMLYFIQT